MIVRELLNNAMLNLNLNARDPKVLARSVSLFNGIMRRYSGNNTMTAYQNSVDFTAESDRVTVGRYALKDGYRDVGVFGSVSDIPDASGFVSGVDMAYCDGFYTPSEDNSAWESAGTVDGLCAFFPDVLRVDISDVVSLSFKDGSQWRRIGKTPYSDFFTDGRQVRFTCRPIGENKVEILLKSTVGRTHKLIYTTSMKFFEDSFLELPEIYQPLIEAALTEELGNAFPAVDGTVVDRFAGLRARLEADIAAKNTDDRMLVREDPCAPYDFNRVDMWG